MKTIVIDGKIINLSRIHFVRKETPSLLVISFGTDFIKVPGKPKEIEEIYHKIYSALNEELSSSDKR